MRKRYQSGCLSNVKGSWIAQWWDNGHRRKKTLGKVSEMTKSRAKLLLAKILEPINSREAEVTGETTFDTFLSGVYLPMFRRKWKASTAGSNENRVRVHLRPEFGERRLSSVRRVELQAFLDRKAAAGLSFSTVAHLRFDLKQIFALAVSEGCISKNPAEMVFIPREAPHPQRRVMEGEQVRAMLGALDLRESIIVRLAVLVGMRPGEIFGLQCGDLGQSCAKIRRRIYQGKVDSPKTLLSVRDAALPEGLLADLAEWVARLPDKGPEAWLFPSERLTTPLSKDNVWRRSIGPRLAEIGLDWVNFHVLRRTSSSLMNGLGVEGKVVSEQLGHTLDVNQNVYTQTSLKRRNLAVDTLETALAS